LNDDVLAIEDRAHIIHFAPPALEVHRHAATWFWDQGTFDFVGGYLHLLAEPSLRLYVLAAQLKDAGLNWRQFILERCLTGPALEVAKLKADPSFATEEDRVRAFVEAGHGCRATYFNHSKTLTPPGNVPHLQVRGTAKNQRNADHDILDLLKRRFRLGNG
jgi:hypothetical protein